MIPSALQPTANPPELSLESLVAITVAAIVAIAAPPLLAYNVAPSATFLNQAVAFIGWAILLIVLIAVIPRTVDGGRRQGRIELGAASFFAAMALLVAAAIGSLMAGSGTRALVLSTVGSMLAAVLCAVVGMVNVRRDMERQAFGAVCLALIVVGGLSTLVAIVQVFIPAWADGGLIAPSTVIGRATGNLRQPNHLCSLMMWAIVALVWMVEAGQLRRWLASICGAMFLFTLVLTASRTAWPDGAILLVWAALDRRLSRATRWSMVAACVLYVLMWVGLSEWAKSSHHLFYGAERLAVQTDISSSRFGIWRDTVSLITAHPWFGVGWGDFNFAWSLTPFPDRPVAFFDHTHDIVLQFLVELGVPLGIVISLLLGYAVWRVIRVPDETGASTALDRRSVMRASGIMIVMIVVHSLLEYPLWYAYFLLPTGFLMGLCLGHPRLQPAVDEAPSIEAATPSADRARPWLLAASICMFIASIACVRDYYRIVVIFSPDDDALPLDQRIEAGRHSWFFAHPRRLRRRHGRAASVDRDGVVRRRVALPARHTIDGRVGPKRSTRSVRSTRPATWLQGCASSATRIRCRSSSRATSRRPATRRSRSSARRPPRPTTIGTSSSGGLAGLAPVGSRVRVHCAATHSPDFPPRFSSTFTSPITMPCPPP